MNLFTLSFSYLRQRALDTTLNVLLLGLGIAMIVVLMLFGQQFEDNLQKNAAGIDLVVGAKGSPMQLILSSIYHIDVPTGNIPVVEAEKIMSHRAVKQAIPMALGDSYEGFRVVGTTHAYPAHYEAALASGELWTTEREVTLGAQVATDLGLAVGDTLVSTHGLGEGGNAHGEQPMQVVGVLGATGTVVDRLVLTSVETIWAVHGIHPPEDDHGDDAHEGEAHEGEGHAEEQPAAAVPPRPSLPMMAGAAPGGGPPLEYTALLVQYASPLAVAMFPRFVNSQSALQAASPSMQIARLSNQLGVGITALRAFGVILILAAALGVFIALYNALQARRYDLAIMRTLGASQSKLFVHVILEGLLLSVLGLLVGLALGHGAAELLGQLFSQTRQLDMTGWTVAAGEAWLIVLALGVGFIASLIPAWQAYRTDIAATLARA